MKIRSFQVSDKDDVVALWHSCGLVVPWNNPVKDIERKLSKDSELFLVAEKDGQILASIMGGFEGHRGWINYLAVKPENRRQGIGRQLMQIMEEKLVNLGCPKINLQIRTSNKEVQHFYDSLGYTQDNVVSYGKRLIAD